MSTISRYVLVDRDDHEQTHEYDNYTEAISDARTYDSAVIERTYEYTDSELVWTPDGSNVWPPKKPDESAKLAKQQKAYHNYRKFRQ